MKKLNTFVSEQQFDIFSHNSNELNSIFIQIIQKNQSKKLIKMQNSKREHQVDKNIQQNLANFDQTPKKYISRHSQEDKQQVALTSEQKMIINNSRKQNIQFCSQRQQNIRYFNVLCELAKDILPDFSIYLKENSANKNFEQKSEFQQNQYE